MQFVNFWSMQKFLYLRPSFENFDFFDFFRKIFKLTKSSYQKNFTFYVFPINASPPPSRSQKLCWKRKMDNKRIRRRILYSPISRKIELKFHFLKTNSGFFNASGGVPEKYSIISLKISLISNSLNPRTSAITFLFF